MNGLDEQRRGATIGLLLLVLFALSITPIRSYDYFWHLATGHWILDHRSLPETDPFTLSSDDTRWVDGAWLFQVGAALVDDTFGSTGTSLARGLCVALIFAAGFAVVLRRSDPTIALLVAAISLWGADHRLTTRPETLATLLLVVALWLLFERRPVGRTIVLYTILTIVWMSSHPSALLAPVLAGLVLVGRLVSGERGRDVAGRFALVASSGVALLANPWGLDGVLAPLRLAKLVGSGVFVNMEWTPTKLHDFPLVYLVVLGLAAAFVPGRRWKAEAARLLVFGFLAALAIRYVRNHGFFFAAVPFIVSPLLPHAVRPRLRVVAASATALLLIGLLWAHGGIRTGIDDKQFPVASVAHLRALGLEGNIYNPDQFGGYLIRAVYPERRVLTDGRNELHTAYIEEYAKARLDQHAWNALIDKYAITLAVDEYRREPIEVVDAATGERRRIPASLVYFPRRDWALVAFDDVAMVFARRNAFDPETIDRAEFRAIVPDGPIPLADLSPGGLAMARAELARARSTFGDQQVIERISAALGGGRKDR
jgi:hypothetical protein